MIRILVQQGFTPEIELKSVSKVLGQMWALLALGRCPRTFETDFIPHDIETLFSPKHLPTVIIGTTPQIKAYLNRIYPQFHMEKLSFRCKILLSHLMRIHSDIQMCKEMNVL